jgi:addiction module HigA family antidote
LGRSFGFPDTNEGEYLKTTAKSTEAAEIAERDLSAHVPLSCIFSANSASSASFAVAFWVFGLEPLALSVTDGAKLLGVTRQALNNVINGKSGISPEMAIRLTKAFGSTPETWLKMQLAYDLAQARKNEHRIKVRRHRVEEVPALR